MVNINSKKDKQTVELSKLWSVLNSLHGSMQYEDSLNVIVSLAVIAKITPDEFYEIYKFPMASQQNELLSLLDTHPLLKSLDTLDSLRSKFLTAELLQRIIYCVKEFSDYGLLADGILATISGTHGKRWGESVSAPVVVEFVKKLIGDVSQSKVYDGAAGLCAITSKIDVKQLVLEDSNANTWSLGKNILMLKGINADYRLNNSLFEVQPSASADLVVSQPPWGLRLSPNQRDRLRNAKFLQFAKEERIPASAGDALWIQHALYNLNESGRAIMLLPQGWLFRGGYDAKLRAYLLEHDLIEGIIGLPSGLMQFTNIPTVILILNKNKKKEQRGIINYVDASQIGNEDKRQKTLIPEDIELIVSLAKAEKPGHKYYKAVLLPDIYQNNNNLNIKLYIHSTEEFEVPSLKEEQAKLKEVQDIFASAQTKLLSFLADSTPANRQQEK